MQATSITERLPATIRGLASSLSGRGAREGGIGLVEVLIALAITGGAVVMFLSGLGTGAKATAIVSERTIAEGLAQSQIEYIKSQAYIAVPGTYSVISPLPAGYTVLAETASVSGRDGNIQKVTVTVYRGEQPVLTRQALKVNL